jgi:clan AA aspartic protease
MIEGTVMPWREAVVRLTLCGLGGRDCAIHAILDTGFSGEMLLPRDIVDELALVPEGEEAIVLADGSRRDIPYYNCTVIWDGTPRDVSALCADGDALIGMALIWDHTLTMRATANGEASIESLS